VHCASLHEAVMLCPDRVAPTHGRFNTTLSPPRAGSAVVLVHHGDRAFKTLSPVRRIAKPGQEGIEHGPGVLHLSRGRQRDGIQGTGGTDYDFQIEAFCHAYGRTTRPGAVRGGRVEVGTGPGGRLFGTNGA
jgi:hypothetical protein